MDNLFEHFGEWGAVIFFIVIYGVALIFIPFQKKTDKKPSLAYLAFIVAFAIEMHGIPFSMYVIASVIGRYLPEGFLWGHTLINQIGYLGLYLNVAFAIAGLTIVILGWYQIYHGYWKKVQGTGQVVTRGIYRYIRHPQYSGLILIAFGMLCGWATLTNIIMFPIIVMLYVRLAKKEEKNMISEFGDEYVVYMKKTKRFIPFVL